jgi:hypothetical protein
VALFSANGLKTQPADPQAPFTEDDAKKPDTGWGARELVADGHDNVWILVVGDALTYGSFDRFQERVKACALEVDVDEGSCTFELPHVAGPKLKMEVDVEDGSKVHRPATTEWPLGSAEILETRFWPRWSIEPSASTPAGRLRFGVRGGEKLERGYVEFGDERWRIHASVTVPSPDDPQKSQEIEASVEHDLRVSGVAQRRVVDLPPVVPPPAGRLATKFRSDVSEMFRRAP